MPFLEPTVLQQNPPVGFLEKGVPDGRPVFFLHGAYQNAEAWDDIVSLLPDHRAICVNLPDIAIGRTPTSDAFVKIADAVAEAMRAYSPGQRVPIVGVSLGACVGLVIAIRHPGIVGRSIFASFRAAKAYSFPWFFGLGPTLERVIDGFASLWRSGPDTFPFKTDMLSAETRVLALASHGESRSSERALRHLMQAAPNVQSATVSGGADWVSTRPDLFARILIHWIEDASLPNDPDIRPCLREAQAGPI